MPDTGRGRGPPRRDRHAWYVAGGWSVARFPPPADRAPVVHRARDGGWRSRGD
ncbi:MAG: hypothetical protein AVDCRST_MAG41-2035 [uncultured Corynebacteriales bacterium]|uniref:Uncharacterized protein n=1 Tax=uncultured Mycobacteriales bacterium TaxID=581187 RepID=A0A6J4IGY2_9ACTN|nr:MAG: hypothetical protein AVDCRST_MAG41-2035 [uncultured Corynebacteriales bacterium]